MTIDHGEIERIRIESAHRADDFGRASRTLLAALDEARAELQQWRTVEGLLAPSKADRDLAALRAKLEDLASTWDRDAKYGQTTDPASELREVLRGE